jgi:CBS domain containing-hemolysin-like protein
MAERGAFEKGRAQTAAPAAMTDAEYQELLDMAYRQGTLAESEKEIILQIISLDQRTARDVMRPRAGMACISDDATVEEMIAAAKKFKHRRLPILRRNAGHDRRHLEHARVAARPEN